MTWVGQMRGQLGKSVLNANESHLPRPVLVVKIPHTMKAKSKKTATGSKRTGSSDFSAKTILVPLDFSEPSKNALRSAFALAQKFGGKLVLFYALEPVATPDFAYHPLMMETGEAVATAVRRLADLCEHEGIEESWIRETIVRKGTPHAEITKAAEDLGADLIVIATHGHTGLKHVVLGSTAERVVRHAHCPVLVVRV